ncbi:Uncharacterised protein [Klebsiella pneumoniae]|nr:Uncharacterised protein [Klebsiella pneumoniae]
MAGFRRRQRQAYRLAVAQLTKQNHIRIFTQRAAQGLGKGRAVQAYLPLLDQATFTLVHKLHRIFQGQNVPVRLVIEEIDHRGQGGRFPTAGGAGDQNQAIVIGQKLRDRSRHT